jgi:hypothetical protein
MKYYLIINQDKNLVLQKFYDIKEAEARIENFKRTYRLCNRQYPKLIVIEKND